MIDVFANYGRWLRGSVLLLLVAVTCIVQVTPLHGDEGTDTYKAAVGLYKQKRYQKAAEQFRKFVDTYETHEKAALGRLYLGLSLLYLDKFKEAREELRRFVSENKREDNLALARFRIAECSYLMDDLASAKPELDAFVKSYPDSSMCEDALPYFGDTLLRSENPDPAAALAVFNRAIDKYPQGRLIDDTKFGRARSLEMMKKFDEAITQYQELVGQEKSPRAADALFHLGAIYYEKNDYLHSLKAYTDFVEKFPRSSLIPNAQLNAGYALFHLKRYDEALRQFEKVAKDPAQKVTASYWQGRCLKSVRDYAKAAEILKSVSAEATGHPLAEALLFEQGLCERNLDHPAPARQFFEQVLKQFPRGEYADDSLHYLIEMSIDAGELAEAEQLLEQFHQNYPQSPHRLLIEMLNGRLELARATALQREKKPADELNRHYDAAARHFEQVMNESSILRAKRQARYYLALTSQLQEQPAKALEIIAPLIQEVLSEGANSDLTEALVLQADCYSQLQDSEKALKSATSYLELSPMGRQAARALSIQAIAATILKEIKTAESAVSRLNKEFPEHPTTAIAVQKLAEAAEGRQDWTTAVALYTSIINNQKDPEKRVYALRGLALAQYSQSKFTEAAASFAQIAHDFPNHQIALECVYYSADSLRKAGENALALEQFQKLFASNPATEPATAGAETEPPLFYYYQAGQRVANLLAAMNKVDDAAAAYELLLTRFPHPGDLDARLKDWALLNANHERYDRADVIWQRLLQETPKSSSACLARLYLAESDLFANKLDRAKQAFDELGNNDKCKPEIRERALFQLVTLAVEQEQWADVRTVGDQLLTLYPQSEYRYYVTYSQTEIFFANSKQTEEERSAVRETLQSLQAQASNDQVRNAVWFDRVWVLLAELNYLEKKYDDVVTVVDDLKKRNPKSLFLYQAEEILGRSYKQQAPPKFDEARAAFERVIANLTGKGTETAAKAQFQIGDTYVFQRKWDEAQDAYNKVFSLYEFPFWKAEALFAIAGCDEMKKDWKSAIESYKLLIDTFPESSKVEPAKTRLGEAQKKVGGKSE
jgi:cellulose synthase operon protein C